MMAVMLVGMNEEAFAAKKKSASKGKKSKNDQARKSEQEAII